MKCDELLKLLGDYVDGQVDQAICKELEGHLAGCDPCRVVIDNLRKTIRLYKENDVYELPVDFSARLHIALKDKWRSLPEQVGGDGAADND
jgi:anti-sigma factor RsiW